MSGLLQSNPVFPWKGAFCTLWTLDFFSTEHCMLHWLEYLVPTALREAKISGINDFQLFPKGKLHLSFSFILSSLTFTQNKVSHNSRTIAPKRVLCPAVCCKAKQIHNQRGKQMKMAHTKTHLWPLSLFYKYRADAETLAPEGVWAWSARIASKYVNTLLTQPTHTQRRSRGSHCEVPRAPHSNVPFKRSSTCSAAVRG